MCAWELSVYAVPTSLKGTGVIGILDASKINWRLIWNRPGCMIQCRCQQCTAWFTPRWLELLCDGINHAGMFLLALAWMNTTICIEYLIMSIASCRWHLCEGSYWGSWTGVTNWYFECTFSLLEGFQNSWRHKHLKEFAPTELLLNRLPVPIYWLYRKASANGLVQFSTSSFNGPAEGFDHLLRSKYTPHLLSSSQAMCRT